MGLRRARSDREAEFSSVNGVKISLVAFSLVELLVVIAVIVTLAVLSLPVAGRSREKARETWCTSNLKQIHAGFLLYQADNDGRFPTSFRWQNQIWAHANFVGGKDGWDTNVPPAKVRPLYPYLGASDAFSCPADVGINTTNEEGRVLAPSLFAAIGSSYCYNIGAPRRLGETELINGLAGRKWIH